MRCMQRAIFTVAVVVSASIPLPAAEIQQAGFLGKPLESWTQELNASQPAPVRRSAAFALGKLGGQAFPTIPRLVKAIEDQDPTVRDAAAYALGEIALALGENATSQWDRTGRTLTTALANDPDAFVRRSCAFALGSQGKNAAPAQEALRRALKDREPIVRQQAARALGRLGDADAASVGGLCAALNDGDAWVRRDAALALSQVGQPTARPALQPLLARFKLDKDVNARRAALDALANLVGPDDKGLVKDLLQALRGGDEDTRRSAAMALGNIGGPEAAAAVGPLCDILREDDPVSNGLAAAALGNLGADAAPAIPELARLLRDSDASTRRNASLALGRIGRRSEPAVPELVRLLNKDEPDEVRRYAAEAIYLIGSGANKAIPDLKRVLKEDTNAKVRVKAVMALGNFEVRQQDIRTALEEPLNESGPDMTLVRYNAALVLTSKLGQDVSAKTIDVLQEALFDKNLQIYGGSSAKVKGTGGEARSGNSQVTESDEGDGRELIANALSQIGRRANRPEIIEGLEDAAQSRSERMRDAAKEALMALKGK
jgi:HEAT repeat protein